MCGFGEAAALFATYVLMDFSWPGKHRIKNRTHGNLRSTEQATGDRYLHQLVPVLNGFAGVGQHGRPVLSARTFSVAAYTAHPNHLIMANTERCRTQAVPVGASGGQA